MLEKKQFCEIFNKYDIDISNEEYEKFSLYSEMLCEWNEKINLTAICDDEGIAIKHFFDSIYPFTLFDFKKECSLIDVGTGAGFPSCPLKIMMGDIKITLLDSLNKRINFLSTLSEALGLEAECIHSRAEELGRKEEYRESFDYATARAVANLSHLCEYCLPFVKVGGLFVALKGSNCEDELKDAKRAIKVLGGVTENVINYTLPTGDGRSLILIRKEKEMDEKYPRNSGIMKKKPLK